jgi:imidazolonepropionase-like amidohydrolase
MTRPNNPLMSPRSVKLAGIVSLLAFGCTRTLPRLASDNDIVFIHGNVIDAISAEPLLKRTVIVRADRIVAIEPDSFAPSPGATVIDLRGRWLMPGLIDAHVHLRDAKSARALLSAGVTTARSLGVDNFVDVVVRDRHRAGDLELPDILAAGYQVRRRMADAFFLNFPALSDSRAGIYGDSAVRTVIRALVTRNVDVVKVMATNRAGVSGVDFRTRMLTDAELRSAVEEASKAKLPVAAHAHTEDGVRASVLAGVRTIEHGTLIGSETLQLMKERGTCFVPTLSFWTDMAEARGEYDSPDLRERGVEMLPLARRTVQQAAKLGVKLVAGSDMRYDSTSLATVADEIAELMHGGVAPMEALRAATSVAAECLGIDRRTGSVQAGLEADLIVLEENPLTHPAALKHPVLVLNDGKVTMNHLQSPILR